MAAGLGPQTPGAMRRQKPPGSDPWAGFAPGTGGPFGGGHWAAGLQGLQRLPGRRFRLLFGSPFVTYKKLGQPLSLMRISGFVWDQQNTTLLRVLSFLLTRSFIALLPSVTFTSPHLGWPTGLRASRCIRSLNSVRKRSAPDPTFWLPPREPTRFTPLLATAASQSTFAFKS